ncbi:glycoside hydrolase family 2 TIM barrel-domain containing protein [Streptococcus marmotae]|uniref:glycoside hydrolase family 2 TIM barrel-domain containing protein n=1 Tax=Streptococcus marmotae TaxID=1825069 RepID=UPI00082C65FD|nr:glycoside hydrolase family 2 TIM barrel-domain containing protein [Streptococcus marmotae]
MKETLYNQGWKFWKDGDSFALVWDVPNHAREITVPHDAMLELEPYSESQNGGNTGFRDGENYVYLKNFTLTKEVQHKRFILKFEGSYMNTFVYVNGQLAGKHHFGYTTFEIPIHDFLNIGDNEIRVQVRNGAMSNSRWYSGSGLYRDVYLLESEQLHFSSLGSRVKTVELNGQDALIEVGVAIENETARPQRLSIETRIFDAENQLIVTDERPYFLPTGQKEYYSHQYLLTNATFWTAETPILYKIEQKILQKGFVIDEVSKQFGIRTIHVDSKRGLRINGQPVKLRGACIHHDSGLLGAKTYETAHRRQIRILKDAGFNAIRMAHHPAAPALLKACDELGMYVMDETFDMWTRFKSDFDYSLVFEEQWEKDVKAMVDSDYNHPSVILYSIGNEIPEIATEHGSYLAKKIHDAIKAIDNSRPTLAGINGIFASGDRIPEIMADVAAQSTDIEGNVNDFMTLIDQRLDEIVTHPIVGEKLELATAATDIAGYNYMTARYEVDSKQYPNRIMVGSETYPPEIARNWTIIQQLPSVIGDFTWTGWDYIGEAGVGVPAYRFGEGGFSAQFPCQLAYTGDIDITGVRRPLSYYREIVFGFRRAPYIAVQNPTHYGEKLIKTPWVLSDSISSWTWNGHEGQPVIVEVYAPGEQVALYLNDELVEIKEVGTNLAHVTYFELPYQAGVLKAINYQNGQIIGETILSSADVATMHLTATVEENEDLTYISLALEDENDVLITNQDCLLSVEVSGAEILGFGSGNPKPDYHYQSNITTTYNGRALLIVQKSAPQTKVIVEGRNNTVIVDL